MGRAKWILAVVGSAGIVATMAGAHGGSPTLIHACVNKVTKIVRIVAPTAKCKRTERAVDWPAQTAVGAQGVQGPQGPPGAPGAPGQPGQDGADGAPGISWQGAWGVGTAYDVGDGVFHQGSSYIAIAESTGEPPGTGPSWGLLAQRGSDGRDGEPGLRWEGPWDEARQDYVLGDAVEHNGSSWIFIGEGRAGEPGISGEWALVAQKGDPGPTGATPAPHQSVIGTLFADDVSASELPIRGFGLVTNITPGAGHAGGHLIEHSLELTREMDRFSPAFMEQFFAPGPGLTGTFAVRLKTQGTNQSYVDYVWEDAVLKGFRQAAGTPNREVLTFQLGNPTMTVAAPQVARPPGAGTVVGRVTLGTETPFDIVASSWSAPDSNAAAAPEPLEIARRHGGDSDDLFTNRFLDGVVFSTARVELYAPGTTNVAMIYNLTDAWISKWATAAEGAANLLPTESLTIRYESFEQTVPVSGTDPAFCWDWGAIGGPQPC